jgi:hypothetical protein
MGRRVIGVWSIVRIPADTLADGKVKKHPLEYGLSKVFPRQSVRVGLENSLLRSFRVSHSGHPWGRDRDRGRSRRIAAFRDAMLPETLRLGIEHVSARDDNVFRLKIQIRDKPPEDDCRSNSTENLSNDKTRNVTWADACERIGQATRDGYGWIGKRG